MSSSKPTFKPKVKVQVGVSSQGNDHSSKLHMENGVSDTQAAISERAILSDLSLQNRKLFELCDPYLVKKRKAPDFTRIAHIEEKYHPPKMEDVSSGHKVSNNSSSASVVSAPSLHNTAMEEQSPNEVVPQLTLTVDGKMVLQQSSLVVNEPVSNNNDYEEVIEGTHATATYHSFLKRRHSYKWTYEETKLFYRALRQTGTEFSIMQSFFPNRTRRQLKLKFQREERERPELIQRYLNSGVSLDTEPFLVQYGHVDAPVKRETGENEKEGDDGTTEEASGDAELVKKPKYKLYDHLPGVFDTANDTPDLLIDV